MTGKCMARMSLILPIPDDGDPIVEYCEKSEGHGDYHGTLSGYHWYATDGSSNNA